MHWDFALLLVFLGVAIPWLGKRRMRQFMQVARTTKMDRLVLYASTMVFQWPAAGVILWRTRIHGISPARLGFAVANVRLIVATSVVLSALTLVNQVFSLRRMLARPLEIKGVLPLLVKKLLPQDDMERLAFCGLVVTVAICEEFIYRGFVQRVFDDWLGDAVPAGILVSAVFFAFAHLYQGRRGVLATFGVGLLFSLIRGWTGSLIPTMGAHFVADLAVGFLAPHYLRSVLVDAANPEGDAPGTQHPVV
jgi:membrane protease YdiL (CAAX protease family)